MEPSSHLRHSSGSRVFVTTPCHQAESVDMVDRWFCSAARSFVLSFVRAFTHQAITVPQSVVGAPSRSTSIGFERRLTVRPCPTAKGTPSAAIVLNLPPPPLQSRGLLLCWWCGCAGCALLPLSGGPDHAASGNRFLRGTDPKPNAPTSWLSWT